MATTNSVNFQTNSHPPQDRSDNYPFFQQNKNKKQAPHHTDYLSSDDDYLQPDIFAPYTQEYRGQGVQKPHTYHRTFSPHPTDTQNQQGINTIQTISHETHHIIEIETTPIIEVEIIQTTEIRIIRTIDQGITH